MKQDHGKINIISFIATAIAVGGACVLIWPGIDRTLDKSMAMHMVIQMGGLCLFGTITGVVASRKKTENPLSLLNRYGLAGLLFFAGSLVFRMLPRSIDMAVYDNIFDNVMHAHLFAAGFALGAGLKHMPFVLKTAAGVYGLAMLLSAAITYKQHETLLCAAYDLAMQKQNGDWLLNVFWTGFVLFILLGAKNLVMYAQRSVAHDVYNDELFINEYNGKKKIN